MDLIAIQCKSFSYRVEKVGSKCFPIAEVHLWQLFGKFILPFLILLYTTY